MVIIFNKSNRPIGIAGQSVLPDREIRVKDKDAYCDMYDEEGKKVLGKKILPGLKILEMKGFITIRVEEEKKEEPVAAEEPKAEPKKRSPKRKKVEDVPAE